MNRHLYIFNTNPVFNEQSPFKCLSAKDPPIRVDMAERVWEIVNLDRNYQYKNYLKTWMNRHLYIFNPNPVFKEQSPFKCLSTNDLCGRS